MPTRGKAYATRNKYMAIWRASDTPCVLCGAAIDYSLPGTVSAGPTLEHYDAKFLGGDEIPAFDACGPAHKSCNSSSGNRLRRAAVNDGYGNRKRNVVNGKNGFVESSSVSLAERRPLSPQGAILPSVPLTSTNKGTLTPDDDQDRTDLSQFRWNKESPWVGRILKERPENAVLPRIMSGPHPQAKGTYLNALEKLSKDLEGTELRWWQRLVAARMLEYDENGDLVWFRCVISTARQSGKSTLMRLLALDRIRNGEKRHGETQMVMHVAKNILIAMEVQRRARHWARRTMDQDWKGRESNGQTEVSWQENRWLVRGRDSSYGYSNSVVFIDEAFAITNNALNDTLLPTLIERSNPQLWLVSTANWAATSMMPAARTSAIEQVANPDDTLIVEWSTPPNADVADVEVWKRASPHWSKQREKLMRSKFNDASAGRSISENETDPMISFRSQDLNQWPTIEQRRTDSLVDPDDWLGARVPGLRWPNAAVTAAVESTTAGSSAVSVAWEGALTLCVVSLEFSTLDDAWTFVRTALPDDSTVLAGVSLRNLPEAVQLGVVPAGSQETRTALPLLASLVRSHELAWDGDGLAGQVQNMNVRRSKSATESDAVVSTGPSHLARTAGWSIQKVFSMRGAVPKIW